MLGLQLRDEFKGRRLKGTAIELTNKNNTGATQVPASDFLRITYPSTDVLKALEAVGPDQGLPLTLKGDRGEGKSHLMATVYHAFTDVAATQHWLDHWAGILPSAKIDRIELHKPLADVRQQARAGLHHHEGRDGQAVFEGGPGRTVLQLLSGRSQVPSAVRADAPSGRPGRHVARGFCGADATMRAIFEKHHVGRPYLSKNYKEVLQKLEADGKMTAAPPASKQRRNTFGDEVCVTFPAFQD
jgi:hypothetical protein